MTPANMLPSRKHEGWTKSNLHLRNDEESVINAQNVLQRILSEALYLRIPPATPAHTSSCSTEPAHIFLRSNHLKVC